MAFSLPQNLYRLLEEAETLHRLHLPGLGLDNLGQPGMAPAIRILLATDDQKVLVQIVGRVEDDDARGV
jgi:hypothetical protein